jgi:hypothetical protein
LGHTGFVLTALQITSEVWEERLVLLYQECPGIQVHHITEKRVCRCDAGGQASGGGGSKEDHRSRGSVDAPSSGAEQARARTDNGDLAAKWKIIPGDDTRLEEVMATAMKELLRQPRSVEE